MCAIGMGMSCVEKNDRLIDLQILKQLDKIWIDRINCKSLIDETWMHEYVTQIWQKNMNWIVLIKNWNWLWGLNKLYCH